VEESRKKNPQILKHSNQTKLFKKKANGKTTRLFPSFIEELLPTVVLSYQLFFSFFF
jgi:hypothetical protein